jgi:hypothetical protein
VSVEMAQRGANFAPVLDCRRELTRSISRLEGSIDDPSTVLARHPGREPVWGGGQPGSEIRGLDRRSTSTGGLRRGPAVGCPYTEKGSVEAPTTNRMMSSVHRIATFAIDPTISGRQPKSPRSSRRSRRLAGCQALA